MKDFFISLLDVVFWLFDKTDNVIVFVPTCCMFIVFSFAIFKRLFFMR